LTKATPTTVRDFSHDKYSIREFTHITLNISAKLNQKLALLKLSCEAYIIDNLLASMLIDTDILDSHEIVINIAKS
jgi:hypothetical protein